MLNLLNNKFNFITMVALDVQNYSDFVYFKKYILNKLDNTQYYVYSSINSVKALWKAFNKKFKVEVVVMKNVHSWQISKSKNDIKIIWLNLFMCSTLFIYILLVTYTKS